MDEYKVERLIDDLLPRAIRPTRAGVRVSLDIYFRQNDKGGPDWAEVVFLDPETRKQMNDPENTIPLDELDAVSWWIGRLVDKVKPMISKRRTG